MKKKSGLRLIAIFKLVKGLLMIGVSFGIFRLIHADLERVADSFLNLTRMDPDNHYIHHFLVKFVDLSPETIKRFGIGALVYSVLLMTEGFGLWFEKTWAEYLVILASSIFVPLEIHELLRHPTPLKLGVFFLNLLIIGYLSYVVVLGKKEGRARHGTR